MRRRSREKNASMSRGFLRSSRGTRDATDEPPSAAGAAGDGRAARPSCANIAAALLHCLSRLGRRLTAPRRLAATRGSSSSSEKSAKSSKETLAAAEKAAATLPLMVALLAVELAALCSGGSNMGASKVDAAAGSEAAGNSTRQGKVDAAQRAARWGEGERAPEVVATAVPPIAKDVLRRPLRPQPARCESLERDRSAHTVGTKSVRAGPSSPVCSMHPVGQHKRLRGTKMWRRRHRRSGQRGGRQRPPHGHYPRGLSGRGLVGGW